MCWTPSDDGLLRNEKSKGFYVIKPNWSPLDGYAAYLMSNSVMDQDTVY
jgi:hypothetical protein